MPTNSPARSGLSRDEVKDALIFFNWNLGFSNVYVTLCVVTGFIFTDFALSLGVARERMGYFSALTSVACVLQLVGLWLLNVTRDRKRFVLTAGYLEPLLVLLAVAAAVLLGARWRLAALLGLLFCAAAAGQLTRPAIDEWLASVIPPSLRGRFLGRRLQIGSIVLILTSLAGGFIAQHLNRGNSRGFALLLGAGCLSGLLAVRMLRRIPLPEISASGVIHWADMLDIRRNIPYVRLLLAVTSYNLAFLIAVPYYQVFHLQVLGMRESSIALLMGGYYVIKILVSPACGRWVDRWGSRTVLLLMAPLYALFFLMYVLCGTTHSWMLFCGWMLAGIGDAGFFVASSTALYAAIPESSRQAYFAVYNLISLLCLAVGAALAVPLVERLKGVSLTIGAVHMGQFHLLYALCTILFALSMIAVWFALGTSDISPQRRRDAEDTQRS